MMHSPARMFEQRQAMMARVHMHETSFRLAPKITDPKTQHISVEGQCRIKVRDHKHDMAHAQGASAKAGDIAARPKRRVGERRPVKDLDPVSVGIMKRNEVANKPLIDERRWFMAHGNTC